MFTAKTREPRTKRNPRNGTKVAVPEKVFVAFKYMHRRVNPSEE